MDSDGIRRFLFDRYHVRGVRVHLTETWMTLLGRHPYPLAVQTLLGQSLAAVSLLAATIKFDGSLIMQMSGNGPVPMLVVQSTAARTVRGMASVKSEPEADAGPSISQLIGSGHLAITIDPGGGKERYQGIVGLDQDDLASVIDGYFANSEQLPTRLWLAADGHHAAGLLLQALPQDEFDEAAWQHLTTLAETLQPDELLNLDTEAVLRRLYHSEEVRLFEPEAVQFFCRCSRERVSDMLRAMPLDELKASAMDEGGALSVSCDFCNAHYGFDIVDLEALFAVSPEQAPGSNAKH